jgi:hypothetical protein
MDIPKEPAGAVAHPNTPRQSLLSRQPIDRLTLQKHQRPIQTINDSTEPDSAQQEPGIAKESDKGIALSLGLGSSPLHRGQKLGRTLTCPVTTINSSSQLLVKMDVLANFCNMISSFQRTQKP